MQQDYAALKSAKISADSLNASLQKQIGQLELVIGENNAQVKQLEKELSAQVQGHFIFVINWVNLGYNF